MTRSKLKRNSTPSSSHPRPTSAPGCLHLIRAAPLELLATAAGAGLSLFGLAAGAPWWTTLGVLAMVTLFVGVSIPMAEQRSLARRPRFAEHQRRVSLLIPWFPSKTE